MREVRAACGPDRHRASLLSCLWFLQKGGSLAVWKLCPATRDRRVAGGWWRACLRTVYGKWGHNTVTCAHLGLTDEGISGKVEPALSSLCKVSQVCALGMPHLGMRMPWGCLTARPHVHPPGPHGAVVAKSQRCSDSRLAAEAGSRWVRASGRRPHAPARTRVSTTGQAHTEATQHAYFLNLQKFCAEFMPARVR